MDARCSRFTSNALDFSECRYSSCLLQAASASDLALLGTYSEKIFESNYPTDFIRSRAASRGGLGACSCLGGCNFSALDRYLHACTACVAPVYGPLAVAADPVRLPKTRCATRLEIRPTYFFETHRSRDSIGFAARHGRAMRPNFEGFFRDTLLWPEPRRTACRAYGIELHEN